MRGSRKSTPIGPRSRGSSPPAVESLETRRLLSADLTLSFGPHTPATLVPGTKAPITIRLQNQGDAKASGPVSVALYASTDATLDASDVALASITRKVNLKPGKSINIPLRVTSNVSLSAGTYRLVASVNAAAGTVGDSKADNNVVVSSFAVNAAAPVVDLSAQITELPLQPIGLGGVSQRATVNVVNTGNAPAKGKLAVNWFLSTDQTLDASDTLIAALPVANVNIPAHKSRSFSTTVALPASGVAVGTYYILAQVNADRGIVDSNASNNVAVGTSQVMVVNVAQRRQDGHHHYHDSSREEFVSPLVGEAIIAGGGTIWVASGGDVIDDGGVPADWPVNDPLTNSDASSGTDQSHQGDVGSGTGGGGNVSVGPPADVAPPTSQPSDPGSADVSSPPAASGSGVEPGSASGSDFSSTGGDF